MTVRELMLNLLLNGNPDDEVIVETERTDDEGVTFFDHSSPRHVVHIGLDGETLIECHDH